MTIIMGRKRKKIKKVCRMYVKSRSANFMTVFCTDSFLVFINYSVLHYFSIPPLVYILLRLVYRYVLHSRLAAAEDSTDNGCHVQYIIIIAIIIIII